MEGGERWRVRVEGEAFEAGPAGQPSRRGYLVRWCPDRDSVFLPARMVAALWPRRLHAYLADGDIGGGAAEEEEASRRILSVEGGRLDSDGQPLLLVRYEADTEPTALPHQMVQQLWPDAVFAYLERQIRSAHSQSLSRTTCPGESS